jgi:hypothetical protein
MKSRIRDPLALREEPIPILIAQEAIFNRYNSNPMRPVL